MIAPLHKSADAESDSAPNPPAEIHLVTTVYRNFGGLPAFLSSLFAQVGIAWHLIMIENASPEGPCPLLDTLDDPRINVLRNPANLGFARAVNQGVRLAVGNGAQFLLLINNDTTFSPHFLADLMARRDAYGARVIAPRVMTMHDTTTSWYAGGHFRRDWVFTNVHEPYDPADLRPAREVEFASGCCLGVSTGVLRDVGLLDERFFVYWEDSDFCLRLAAHRIPIIYVRDPFLLHEGGASSGGEFTDAYRELYFRNYARFLVKHFGRIAAMTTMLRLVRRDLSLRPLDIRCLVLKVTTMLRGLPVRRGAEPRL